MEACKFWHFHKAKRLKQIRINCYFFKKAHALKLGISMGRGAEDNFVFTVGIPLLFNFYFGIDFVTWKWWDRLLGCARSRDIFEFSISHRVVELYIFKNSYGWTRGELNGFGYAKEWQEILLGDFDYDSHVQKRRNITRHACPHLGRPSGLLDARWVIRGTVRKVTWKRWYMRLWSKLFPKTEMVYHVTPLFKAAYMGKHAPEQLGYLYIHDATSAEDAVDKFNERLTELQTRYY